MPVFLSLRDNDGQEHAVQGDAQGRDDRRRQQLARRDARCSAGAPHRSGDGGRAKRIGEGQKTGPGDGDAENLVGDAGCQYAFEQRGLRCEFLGERGPHQQISQIGNQAYGRNLEERGVHGHHGIDPVFTGRGPRKEAAQKTGGCRETCVPGRDAQRKGHGEIACGNRNAVPDSFEEC